MKYGSLTIGMFLIIGSDKLSSFISKSYSQGLSIGFIMIGIMMLVYSVSIFFKEFNKKNNEYLEQLEILIEKGATKDNQTTFIEKQNLFIKNQELVKAQVEDKTRELDQRLSQIKTNMEIKLDAICESIQDKGIAETDRQHFKETAESVSAIGRDIIQLKNQLAESRTYFLREVQEIKEKQVDLKIIPKILCESIDELIKHDETVSEDIREQIRILTESISDQYEELAKKLKSAIEEMEDLLEDYDSLTCEKLEQLSGQYDSFKSLSDKMIEKMSLMASQDLEVIKGIMDNGK